MLGCSSVCEQAGRFESKRYSFFQLLHGEQIITQRMYLQFLMLDEIVTVVAIGV